VDNPDGHSEFTLLQSYAPTLSPQLLHKLISSFSELRQLVAEGRLSYPYSTRELVNVVRHLSVFPADPIANVLENIFAFDAFDPLLRERLVDVFERHGIPLSSPPVSKHTAAEKELGTKHTSSGQPLSEVEWNQLRKQTRSRM
jgi:hypothetical protein